MVDHVEDIYNEIDSLEIPDDTLSTLESLKNNSESFMGEDSLTDPEDIWAKDVRVLKGVIVIIKELYKLKGINPDVPEKPEKPNLFDISGDNSDAAQS